MKISAKGRYALAATISLAESYYSGEHVSLINISTMLGISKIYLEQIFSLLKRVELVNSVKGTKGGYQLARHPQQITVMAILSATELSLFESTEETVSQKAPEIDAALQSKVFEQLDKVVRKTLEEISLADLVAEAQKSKEKKTLMYYI